MKKVILIVEDDPKNQLLFRDLLQSHDYATLDANNGKKGVELAKRKKPDLVLMDIMMPVMTGIEAVKILKATPETKNIPVLALTSFAMPEEQKTIIEAGFDGYMIKPLDIHLLLKKIAEYLQP